MIECILIETNAQSKCFHWGWNHQKTTKTLRNWTTRPPYSTYFSMTYDGWKKIPNIQNRISDNASGGMADISRPIMLVQASECWIRIQFVFDVRSLWLRAHMMSKRSDHPIPMDTHLILVRTRTCLSMRIETEVIVCMQGMSTTVGCVFNYRPTNFCSQFDSNQIMKVWQQRPFDMSVPSALSSSSSSAAALRRNHRRRCIYFGRTNASPSDTEQTRSTNRTGESMLAFACRLR